MSPELATPWLVFGVALVASLAAAGTAARYLWRRATAVQRWGIDLQASVRHVRETQERELTNGADPSGEGYRSLRDEITAIEERLAAGFDDHDSRIHALESDVGR